PGLRGSDRSRPDPDVVRALLRVTGQVERRPRGVRAGAARVADLTETVNAAPGATGAIGTATDETLKSGRARFAAAAPPAPTASTSAATMLARNPRRGRLAATRCMAPAKGDTSDPG